MYLRWIFVMMFSAALFSGCQEVPETPNLVSTTTLTGIETLEPAINPKITLTPEQQQGDVSFAITLVDDPKITGSDLGNWTLSALPLAEDPLISTEDVLVYDWETHTFDMTEQSYEYLIAAIGGKVSINGIPFVVIANGERIYAGAFLSLASSLSFDGVVIEEPVFEDDTTIKLVLGYPTEAFFTGEDPRGDPRIREVLKAKGLLH